MLAEQQSPKIFLLKKLTLCAGKSVLKVHFYKGLAAYSFVKRHVFQCCHFPECKDTESKVVSLPFSWLRCKL